MAGTVTGGALNDLGRNSGKYELLLTCTADAAGALSAAVNSATMDNLAGKYVFTITSYPGNPAPTDGSELEIRDSIGREVISSAGNGNDFIDATDTKTEHATGPNTDLYYLASDAYPWTVYMENNAVANAVFYLLLTLTD